MTGYCEGCRLEMTAEQDEYGGDVCVDCGSDLITSVHIEEENYTISEQEAEDFQAFLNRD